MPTGRSIPSAALLEDLQRVAGELGEPPAFTEYDEHGRFGACTPLRRFGSWNAAVREAGLTPRWVPGLTDDDLLEDLQRVADELGEAPRSAEYARMGEHSTTTLADRFGSWNDALREAGFVPRQLARVPTAALLEDLQRVADELGEAPRSAEYTDRGKHSVSAQATRFGSWNAALREAGLSTRPPAHVHEPDEPVGEGDEGVDLPAVEVPEPEPSDDAEGEADGDLITACPECDHGHVYQRKKATPPWRCHGCGHEFETPALREPLERTPSPPETPAIEPAFDFEAVAATPTDGPHCLNCGGEVSRQYVRVFAPDGMANPRVCPSCPDMVRDRLAEGGIRPARSSRTRGRTVDSTAALRQTEAD